MCRNRKRPNYYIAIGMLISTTFYFLREAQMIPDWARLMGYCFAIALMIYGIFKHGNRCKN